MTLTKLTIGVAIAALLLTILISAVYRKKMENLLITYLQCFTGTLFIFSGWVKAVDPLGTAYKMEQYFAEFESTFTDTWVSFLSPMFPVLSSYAIGFSVFVIIFEIVLGIMLLIGAAPKLTSWAFFLLVAFFTLLTGFTFLTGYVPSEEVVVLENTNGATQQTLISEASNLEGEWTAKDTVNVNFFNFGYWQDYKETNMKVTDCGCFGDFLKLKPFTSFMKDIFLLIPALIFLFFSSQFHQLFSRGARTGILLASTAGLLIYCLSNYVWDLPHTDFRPFKKGVDVAAQKEYEAEATAVKVIGYELTNKASGEKVELSMEQLGEMKNYPKSEWEYDQMRSVPEAEPTKISDFGIENMEGYDITDDILYGEGYSFMIVAHKLHYDDVKTQTTIHRDTTFAVDSLQVGDTIKLVQRVAEVKEVPIQQDEHIWEEDYIKRWQEVVNPMLEAAEEEGFNIYAVTKPYAKYVVDDFRHATQSSYPFHKADDILLKTIVRSNPGIVLWKDGVIVDKWHYKKLPSFEEIKASLIE